MLGHAYRLLRCSDTRTGPERRAEAVSLDGTSAFRRVWLPARWKALLEGTDPARGVRNGSGRHGASRNGRRGFGPGDQHLLPCLQALDFELQLLDFSAEGSLDPLDVGIHGFDGLRRFVLRFQQAMHLVREVPNRPYPPERYRRQGQASAPAFEDAVEAPVHLGQAHVEAAHQLIYGVVDGGRGTGPVCNATGRLPWEAFGLVGRAGEGGRSPLSHQAFDLGAQGFQLMPRILVGPRRSASFERAAVLFNRT